MEIAALLLDQLAVYIKDRFVLNLLWQYMHRVSEWGRLFKEHTKGISRGCATTKNPKVPGRVTLQPAVESPKRVPDRQMGQPSFVLDGQYPITGYYVNSDEDKTAND